MSNWGKLMDQVAIGSTVPKLRKQPRFLEHCVGGDLFLQRLVGRAEALLPQSNPRWTASPQANAGPAKRRGKILENLAEF